MKRSRDRYSRLAIFLHWTIAALIVLNVVIGWRYGATKGFAKFGVLQWHKSVGFTVLFLSLVRLGWRMVNPPPPFPASLPPWQIRAANAVHWGFYGVMVGMPLTGWVIVSASLTNIRTYLYKTVPIPHLAFVHALSNAQRKTTGAAFTVFHHQLANILYVLLALHVAAALKHQFVDRDDTLARMLPFARRSSSRSSPPPESPHVHSS